MEIPITLTKEKGALTVIFFLAYCLFTNNIYSNGGRKGIGSIYELPPI